MKRALLIAVVSVVVVVVATGFHFGWNVYPRLWRVALGPRARPLRNIQFERTAARAERGRYLAEGPLTCLRCHSDRDWSQPGAPPVAGKFGAGHIFTEDGRPWLVAPNITPDRETGAGTWTTKSEAHRRQHRAADLLQIVPALRPDFRRQSLAEAWDADFASTASRTRLE
jgi:hypothetical protein